MLLKKKYLKISLLALLSLQLNACSSFFDKDNTPTPNGLTAFQPELNPKLIWRTQTQVRLDQTHLRMGFIQDQNQAFFAGNNGVVTAINLDQGSRIWQVQLPEVIASTPAYSNHQIFISTQSGWIFALDAQDGHTLWKKNVGSAILASPAANSKIVIAKALDGNVIALDSENGQERWRFQQIEPNLILRGSSAPIVNQESAYIGFANGNLAKLALNSGSPNWIQTIATPEGAFSIQRMIDIDADPMLSQGHLFVATYQGNLANLDLSTGRFLWQQKMSSYTGMSIDGSRIFISDANSYVYSFSTENGKILWQNRDLFSRSVTAPVKMQQYVVVGDAFGYLHWFNQQTGKLSARAQVGAAIHAAPLIYKNKVIVLDAKGQVSAFE